MTETGMRAEELKNLSKEELINTVLELQRSNRYMHEQIVLLNQRAFGRKTEKSIVNEDQMVITEFNEAEAIADAKPVVEEKEIIIYERKKSKARRRRISKTFPLKSVNTR